MEAVATTLVGIVAAIHVYILWLEMFAWTKTRGRATFATTAEFAESTKVLAANQGLYNGFLAAGLIWGAVIQRADVQLFFLICVAVAGVYGGLTANRRILYVQALPAVIAAVFVLLAR